MTSLKQLKDRQQGFTIIELLIVIVVIGILAALVITTFSGIQEKGRNTARETDISSLHKQLEAYYAQNENSNYPSLTQLNDSVWRNDEANNMTGLDDEALKDPKGSAATLAAAPAANVYAYEVTNDANTSCEADPATCSKYILTATKEGGGTIVKNSLN